MTAAELARLHRRRAARVPIEFRKTSNGLAIAAVKFCREKLTAEVYAIPEDVNKAGKKKWRRTGHLRRSERAEVVDPYTVRVVNDAAYAEPRHEAGKPGRRNINPLRVSHWRDELMETFRSVLLDAYEVTIQSILRG